MAKRKICPLFCPIVSIFVTYFSTTSALKDPSIIIIGAGSAGIAAATRLLENNFTNVLVLEAENRTGGRINSIYFGDSYIDLGAQWCAGQKDNVVYQMAKNLNIFKHTDYSYKLYHSSGKNMDAELLQALVDIRDSFYQVRSETTQENLTVGDLFINHYNKSVYVKFSHDNEEIDLAIDALDFYLHSILSSDGALSWFDSSAQSDYRDCEGDTQLNWKGSGFKTILEVMMKKIPDPSQQLDLDNKTILNKEVVSVRWNKSNGKVVVGSRDGSNYTADHVIFTPSIGVLKDRGLQMFIPSLPSPKLEAIENIGIGAVAKVFVLFSRNWFGNETNFNFVWSKADKESLVNVFPDGPNLRGRSWLTNLFTVVRAERNPKILTAWFAGELVPAVELMPEEVLTRGIDYTLRKFLGDIYRDVKIEKIVRSKWYSNSHFKGVYSFQTINSKRGHEGSRQSSEEDLAEPINDDKNRPLIQFAGEATHPYHFATVHGAIETGYREANRLIQLYL